MTKDKMTKDEAKQAYFTLREAVAYRLVGEELADLDSIIDALSSPALDGVIRVVRLEFDRHVAGYFVFNDRICLPEGAAPTGVNVLTTLAYIVEERLDE